MSRKNILLAIAGLALMFLGAVLLYANDRDGPAPAPKPPPPAITTHVKGPDRQPIKIEVPKAAAERAEQAGELDNALREPTDTGPAGVLEGPWAAQEFPGCRTRFVRNYSSRNGAAPKVIVWHQTVSRENGWTSQDALTAMANRASSGVSWHFLIGRTTGNCTFSVPLNMKAWTQGNANPFSIGIEVEAYGDEPTYVSGPGRARLVAVTRELGRRFGIPMRQGKVENCRVVRSGIVEHSELGVCGGGHADVTPWSTKALIAEAAVSPVAGVARWADSQFNLKVLTEGERAQARELLARRRTAVRHGGWGKVDASHLRAAEKAKRWLQARNRELHRLGLTRTANRIARHKVIHELI